MRLPSRFLIIALFVAGWFIARASSPVLADMDCADFASHEAAQAYFNANGGSAFNNVDNLDADHDGIACESRPRSYQSSSSSSSSGSASRAITPPAATSESGSGFPWGIFGLGAAGVGGAYVFAQTRKKRPAMASPSLCLAGRHLLQLLHAEHLPRLPRLSIVAIHPLSRRRRRRHRPEPFNP